MKMHGRSFTWWVNPARLANVFVICNTMTKVQTYLAKSSSGQDDEFFHVGLTRGEQGRDDLPTLPRELIPHRQNHFMLELHVLASTKTVLFAGL